jgi:hypothetical protein
VARARDPARELRQGDAYEHEAAAVSEPLANDVIAAAFDTEHPNEARVLHIDAAAPVEP